MTLLTAIIMVSVSIHLVVGEETPIPQPVSVLKISHASFITLSRNGTETDPEEQMNVIISRFNGIPFSSDYLTLVRGLGKNMASPDKASQQDLSKELHWPNEPSSIPGTIVFHYLTDLHYPLQLN